MSFLKELSKVGNVGGTQLNKSDMFKNSETFRMDIPILNLAFSGNIDGGFSPGLHTLAGPSKHYKSNLGLVMMKAFQDKYPEGTVLFYDSEQGATSEYFDSFGIDQDQVLHIPIMDIEELKFDLSQKLKLINTKFAEAKKSKEEPEKIFIFIDSMGNLASKKEVEDAVNEKSVADMTRAKAGKSLWRIVTPYLKKLQIPAVCIQHSYQEIGLYPKTIVGGGCVVAGTKIRMSSGVYKNVEDIKENDKVDTLLGPKNVDNTWNPDTLDEGEPECFEIEFEDGFKVTCSDAHKFLVQSLDGTRVWVRADELLDGMSIVQK